MAAITSFSSKTKSSPDLASENDAELMLAARYCTHTFTTLVGRYRKPLLSYFHRYGVQNDGDDLVQETILRLHRYRDRYQPTAQFTSFLFTLANHARLDYLRSQMRRERAHLDFEKTLSALARNSIETDHGVDVEAALKHLPPKHGTVIRLYFYEGLRLQDVAMRLNIPVGTVKSRLNHALRKLREVLVCLAEC